MNFLIFLMLLVPQQQEAKVTINPEASKKFGAKWTANIKYGLNACAKTVNQLPDTCRYPEDGWMMPGNGLAYTKNGEIVCTWACKNPHPKPLKPKKKSPCDPDAVDGPFWELEYGVWEIDTFGGGKL